MEPPRPEAARGGGGGGGERAARGARCSPRPAPPGMERRRAPAANRRYRQRRFWDALYRQEGAEPREWLGGLSRFLPELEAELRPGDRILVLGTCPVEGGRG